MAATTTIATGPPSLACAPAGAACVEFTYSFFVLYARLYGHPHCAGVQHFSVRFPL